MFDQMKNLKQLAGMMGNMGELREKLEQAQAELARRTVTADAGAGAVRVTANGKLEIVRVQFDPAMLTSLAGEGDQADQEMIEELIVAATNAALTKAQTVIREEMTKATGGLNLPGMGPMLGEVEE